ncbi:hypothetical protein F4810DRAFT_709521 [Camillea tinctor]|nr:hypothetical protein F4810DRAFT_709521 [Camillea tinctor]
MTYTGTVIVTGGTINLGYHAALHIAREHPEYLVIISSRSDREHAADTINKTLGQKNTIFMQLDLADTSNIRAYVKEFTSQNQPPIRALLLNAGLQFPGRLQKTPEGIESTFAVNHVGHALLFHLLCPHLAPQARVVVTSSGTHDAGRRTGLPPAVYTTGEEMARPLPSAAAWPGRKRYASSKLANVLWTYALARRGISATAFDPGLMPGTGLAREAHPALRFLWMYVLPLLMPLLRVVVEDNIHTPQDSGASLARLALGADVEGLSGRYFAGRREIPSSADSYDEAKQEDLWRWTVGYLARDGEERARFEALR